MTPPVQERVMRKSDTPEARSMAYRLVEASHPGSLKIDPPASPLWATPSSWTRLAPPTASTWAGAPGGATMTSWLAPPGQGDRLRSDGIG